WAKDAVAAISAAGIMNGVGNNTFAPTGVYTCEQSALTILRTYEMLIN
ncbi:MAG: S-layer homology domain-containing protein, partial [Clostridia bacterium]|nr:S-layer homology domain-containing protein [Clostridia bacterium]